MRAEQLTATACYKPREMKVPFTLRLYGVHTTVIGDGTATSENRYVSLLDDNGEVVAHSYILLLETRVGSTAIAGLATFRQGAIRSRTTVVRL